jgi:hypothetical protein
MKAYGGMDVQIHIVFISALVGGEWSASRHDRYIPGETAPNTHWIRGWVDTRAGLDMCLRWTKNILGNSEDFAGAWGGKFCKQKPREPFKKSKKVK